ncbi:MAG: Glu-tRNA(Gln) amidotransferase subunit GatE [Candidatus Anstonellales archaeon]
MSKGPTEMKIGLEIHQRLNTKKLFCACPYPDDKDENFFTFKRRLHTTMSEMGEIDSAALHEQAKQKLFTYQFYPSSCCAVEADEEPPHPINKEALSIAAFIAKELNCTLLPSIQVMRKIVVDGSNVSGFQRTALVGLNGSLQTSFGSVGIETVAIEEESAGIVSDSQNERVLDLRRLGIPLVEITTTPEIRSPEQAYETALKIGLILRNTGKVARGIGTIRQDLNVSIPGGARVEIKGVQELPMLPEYVKEEVRRQQALLKIISTIKSIPSQNPSLVDLSEALKGTKSKLLQKALSSGQSVIGVKLKGFKGILGTMIGAKRFGKELSEYASAVGLGIIHSDEEIEKYGIERHLVEKALHCSANDAFIITFGEKERAKIALQLVLKRALLLEVPGETRKANPDGTTSYQRPLPGKARMYPETDIETTPLPKLPEIPSFTERYSAISKVFRGRADEIFLSPYLPLICDNLDLGEGFLSTLFTRDVIELRREGIEPTEKMLGEVVQAFRKGHIVKAAIKDVLRYAVSKGVSVEKAIDEAGLKRISGPELKKLCSSYSSLPELMRSNRLRVDAEEASRYFGK